MLKTTKKENEYGFAPHTEQRSSSLRTPLSNIQSNYSNISNSNMLSSITNNIPSNFTENTQHITSSRT